MKIKDELRELEARRIAFTTMLERAKTEAERAHWGALLADNDEKQYGWKQAYEHDPSLFQRWFIMEDNESLLKAVNRFPQ